MVAAHPVAVLEMADHGLDGIATPHLAADGFGDYRERIIYNDRAVWSSQTKFPTDHLDSGRNRGNCAILSR
jgi:hypothetical protein